MGLADAAVVFDVVSAMVFIYSGGMRVTHPRAYLRHIPFVAALAILSLIFADQAPSKRPEAGVWVALGAETTAPGIEFIGAKGQQQTLADYRGKVVLLNVWATWCTPCLKELPHLEALQKQYRKDGLVVLALSVDAGATHTQLQRFLEARGTALPYLALDAGHLWERALDLRGLPVSYVIDREGRMTHRYIGAANWMDAEKQDPILQALSASQS